MLTDTQRARRIRQLHGKIAKLERDKREAEAELRPLETAESLSLGFSFPIIRGPMLLDAMDRRDEAEARRDATKVAA